MTAAGLRNPVVVNPLLLTPRQPRGPRRRECPQSRGGVWSRKQCERHFDVQLSAIRVQRRLSSRVMVRLFSPCGRHASSVSDPTFPLLAVEKRVLPVPSSLSWRAAGGQWRVCMKQPQRAGGSRAVPDMHSPGDPPRADTGSALGELGSAETHGPQYTASRGPLGGCVGPQPPMTEPVR